MAIKTSKTAGTAPNLEVAKIESEALVERIKAINPKVLGKMPDKRAAVIVRHAMRALATEINETEEGRLRVLGLGSVAIRQVELEKDGQTTTVKRVVLNPAKPKA